jgi:hypothetical protein
MRYTNKKRKSKRIKGGEGNLGDFTETCVINPFRKAGNVLKKGFDQLNELRKSGNEKIENDLQTLSLKLSKMSSKNEPLISPVQKQIEKTLNDIQKNDNKVEALENKTENKVESEIKKSPSPELITLGDLNTRGGRKKRSRKSKKKKRRRKKY